jgi:hypothetical protein
MHMSHDLSFTQLASTRATDVRFIAERMALAKPLGILVGDLETKQTTTLADIESEFGARLNAGGEHNVSETEWQRIQELFGNLAGIWMEIDRVLSSHEHYLMRRREHDAAVERMAQRPANIRVADGVKSNVILEGLCRYAEHHLPQLADSVRSFDDIHDSIKNRDLRRAHTLMSNAQRFTFREGQVASKLRDNSLVEVEVA